MEETVTVELFGEAYALPAGLSVLEAMARIGRPVNGCRSGVCGACAVLCRFSGEESWRVRLACSTMLQAGLRVRALPKKRLPRVTPPLATLAPEKDLAVRLFPQLAACRNCGACSRACPLGLPVFPVLAQAGDYPACAKASFACIDCGACVSVCPAGIDRPAIGMLARRLTGRHLTPSVPEADDGAALDALESLDEAVLRQRYEESRER